MKINISIYLLVFSISYINGQKGSASSSSKAAPTTNTTIISGD
jgi:hypothetical protein